MSTGIGIANLPNQVNRPRKNSPTPTHSRCSVTKSSPSRGPILPSWSLARLFPAPTPTQLTHTAGESGLGKSTLINTLFATELSPLKDYSRRHMKQLDKLTEVGSPDKDSMRPLLKQSPPQVDIIKAELEEKQFKVKLTVIDTPGFGDYVNNRDSW
jgi:hypothetical protein